MKTVFADTGFWVALVWEDDPYHDRAVAIRDQLGPVMVVTSDLVLNELLNFFTKMGSEARRAAVQMVERIEVMRNCVVQPNTRELFDAAIRLYGNRLDKEWSHTDCASMLIMERRNITEALAHDYHFEQRGFRALLREAAE